MSTEQIIELVVALIVGVINMPLTQWLKSKLSIDGTSALALSGALSGALAVAALFVSGAITSVDFAWDALPATLAIVWSTAILVYNGVKGKR